MTIDSDEILMARKFRAAEEKVSEERGGFRLFGLFERQQTPGRWDLVAAAPWLKTDRDGTLELIVLLRDKMDTEDWKIVGAVFPIEPTSEWVQLVNDMYHFDHRVEEIFDPSRGGVHIGHAILITSNLNPTPARATSELAVASVQAPLRKL